MGYSGETVSCPTSMKELVLGHQRGKLGQEIEIVKKKGDKAAPLRGRKEVRIIGSLVLGENSLVCMCSENITNLYMQLHYGITDSAHHLI
jgi:hypothetical protein